MALKPRTFQIMHCIMNGELFFQAYSLIRMINSDAGGNAIALDRVACDEAYDKSCEALKYSIWVFSRREVFIVGFEQNCKRKQLQWKTNFLCFPFIFQPVPLSGMFWVTLLSGEGISCVCRWERWCRLHLPCGVIILRASVLASTHTPSHLSGIMDFTWGADIFKPKAKVPVTATQPSQQPKITHLQNIVYGARYYSLTPGAFDCFHGNSKDSRWQRFSFWADRIDTSCKIDFHMGHVLIYM